MTSFSGGVISSDGTVGIVHVTGTELVAVDLTLGSEMWRNPATGWPVAATGHYLIVLQPKADPVLQVLDLRSGDLLASVDWRGLPDQAGDIAGHPEAIECRARETGARLVVEWQVAPRYSGGAAPRQEDVQRHPDSGRLTISTSDWRIEKARSGEDAAVQFDLDDRPAPESPPLPGEVARTLAGDRQYVLRTEAQSDGGQAIKLDAMNKAGTDKIWELKLGEVGARRGPGPLRK